jgi:hypothetical protein
MLKLTLTLRAVPFGSGGVALGGFSPAVLHQGSRSSLSIRASTRLSFTNASAAVSSRRSMRASYDDSKSAELQQLESSNQAIDEDGEELRTMTFGSPFLPLPEARMAVSPSLPTAGPCWLSSDSSSCRGSSAFRCP